ncbi:MAG: hypothetical protein A3B86_02170 [Candidatus Yanofskybacteria bacterium RIFCSPHIGHO2_02_FULL_38_22b]|uniref:NAD-dependent epimerase/dehydratase domain-containing protein n=1 Tax=Candidatus Yanofskybacteria bacterium RIFCSPHIGHO2_02_FULL_38_22b TaxID=1802673 RepID=A0A1F8F1B3_9BACT|nr:MAG: hypothetical protein A2816_03045 [Candidatus Yanofskybacteria bacterium RIFCSPHIGHO2_01_FULL_39_44]OGN06927.1 MAG: hypothetical protein A3B86_02170 [Candidatus Yanofskybacteria bacterium RIFCSPHIGHO2_02_FULL_38_22b]OGN20669.1 MAG: hypothetical protein A2910_02645 [Candidatus Yanofskybacteria bacterium RIFCSPLOWO2_01_FULL_39_28]
MSRILVTGGAGYIGSVLVPTLLQANHEVIVLDNFLYKQNTLLDCCHSQSLRVINEDVRNKDLLASLVRQSDIIIHLACIVGAPACDRDPFAAKTINLDPVKTILTARTRNQPLLFPNTNSGYGIGQEGIFCTEESPLKPVSLYGRLKVEAEKEILNSGNSISLRLATVFGISPRMRLDLLVNDFVYRAVNDRFIVLFQANFKRNYIHVRDVVRAFLHCINNFDSMKNNAYNVGLSDANLSKLELCQEIKKKVPDFYFTEAEVGEDPDKRNYIVSNAKIEAMGFKPRVSLQEGIEELIKGYRIVRNNSYTNL